jgi:hypothetical protein
MNKGIIVEDSHARGFFHHSEDEQELRGSRE